MATKASKTQKTDKPAVYAVTGTFTPSDFVFYQTTQAQLPTILNNTAPIPTALAAVSHVRVEQAQGYTGTVSNAQKEDSEQVMSSPNLGMRDIATLSPTNDTLIVSGSIRITPFFDAPSTSDVPSFSQKHREFVKTVKESNPQWIRDLATAYAQNIVDGSLVWRNRYGFAIATRIDVKRIGTPTQSLIVSSTSAPAFQTLIDVIETALNSPKTPTHLEVLIAIELGYAAEVYPSQPFADKKTHTHSKDYKNSKGESTYGRILSERNGQAILHSQKIGNALRQIDTWYSDEPAPTPIAVEAFGVVTSQREVHRKPGANSFYDYFNPDMLNHVNNEKTAKYVIAMLIKGGVFGQQ